MLFDLQPIYMVLIKCINEDRDRVVQITTPLRVMRFKAVSKRDALKWVKTVQSAQEHLVDGIAIDLNINNCGMSPSKGFQLHETMSKLYR